MHYLAFINNIGMPELIVIFVVVLLLFGPKSIPKLARALGQGIREFKDATNKVTESITNMDKEDEEPAKPRPAQRLSETARMESVAPPPAEEPAPVTDKH